MISFAERKKVWLHQYKEDQMKKLDAQGRHRSQWCYAPYDGRKEKEIPHGSDMITENKKTYRSVINEILSYPIPIADCDSYFDFLLSERDRLREKEPTEFPGFSE